MQRRATAVVGASGYTGGELLRYLAVHPAFDVVAAAAGRSAGRTVGEVFGHLPAYGDLRLTSLDEVPDVALAFLALPHGEAVDAAGELRSRGVKVVDLSADHRLRDASAYTDWYGWTHPAPEALDGWVYGLPELHRDAIAGADAVANPGCYPTAAILAVAPLLREGIVAEDGIVIDALSGVSGAGRKAETAYLHAELEGSVRAYGLPRHRHTPEIEQELGTRVRFTPHLVPMPRGLLATCTVTTLGGDVRACLETAYKGEAFVNVVAQGVQPATKEVAGSNHARIGVAIDDRTATAIVTCVIDNLGKGAAGQAIQNANLMFGLPETTGLEAQGMYP